MTLINKVNKFTVEDYEIYTEYCAADLKEECIVGLMMQHGFTYEQIDNEVTFLEFNIEFVDSYTIYLNKEARRLKLQYKFKCFYLKLITKGLYMQIRLYKFLGIASEEALELLEEEKDKRLLSQFK